MSITTLEIIQDAGEQLRDISGLNYDRKTLVRYANLGIIQIITLKPEAYAITDVIPLVTGAAQSLPTGAIKLIDIVCNMGDDGETPGDAISPLNKEQMDLILPGWISYDSGTTDTHVSYVIFDDRNPKVFYVFPPQPDPPSEYVKAILSMPPTFLTDTSSIFPFDDSYAPAMVDYIVHRALAEEPNKDAALINKATFFWQKFLQDLGIKTAVETKIDAVGK